MKLLTASTRALVALLLSLQSLAAGAFDADRFSRMIERGMADWQIPGLVAAVIEDGEVVFARGFGSTAVEGGAAVTAATPFANASTTKAMVAAGLLMLVDEGRLELDAPVIEWLPELHLGDPALAPQLTLRDLLAHRTGMPSTDFLRFMQAMSTEEQLARLRYIDPAAPPRSRLIYQNTMYELLGLILERVTGQFWGDFLAERLWGPIGMTDTVARRGDIPADRSFAQPHDVFDGSVRAVEFSRPPGEPNPAGSAWSTVSDMARWAQFLLRGGVTENGDRLLTEAAFNAWFEPAQLAAPSDFYPVVALSKPRWRSYALGWFQQDLFGQRIDFHTGSLAGLVAIIGLDRDAQRAVVVMANRDHAELRHALLLEALDPTPESERRDWHREVFDLYRGLRDEQEKKWLELGRARIANLPPSLAADAYAGRYSSQAWGRLEVQQRGDIWMLISEGGDTLPVTHWHGDLFLVQHPDWHYGEFLQFTITAAGDISSLSLFGLEFLREAVDE